MSKPFHDFHTAWNWLRSHPRFRDPGARLSMNRFAECLEISVVKVDPRSECIEDDKERNTAPRVWLECGEISKLEEEDGNTLFVPRHDIDLDCGAPTFEEAILELADLTLNHYGPY